MKRGTIDHPMNDDDAARASEHTTTIYKIKHWDSLYEVSNKSRRWVPGQEKRRGPLEFVRFRCSGSAWSEGYRDFLDVAGNSAASAFGVFAKLLELSACQDAERRGMILDRRGNPADTACIARMCGFREADVVKALEILSDPRVAWVETDNSRSFPDIPGESGKERERTGKNGTLLEYNTSKDKTSINTNTSDSAFAEFWTVFPKKVNKPQALKAWKKLDMSNGLLKLIIEAVGIQRKSRQWKADGGKYIPHPASWLNGRRWEDEVDEPQPNMAEKGPGYDNPNPFA